MADLQYGRSRLPEQLTMRGISQVEFSRRLGVSESFVSKLISGEKKFSLLRAKKAADILDCLVEDLYEWEYN